MFPSYVGNREASEMHRAVLALPKKLQSVLYGKYAYELTTDEMAEVFGDYQPTLKEALAQLRQSDGRRLSY